MIVKVMRGEKSLKVRSEGLNAAVVIRWPPNALVKCHIWGVSAHPAPSMLMAICTQMIFRIVMEGKMVA